MLSKAKSRCSLSGKKLIFLLLIIHCSLIIAECQWQSDIRLTNNPASSYTSHSNEFCVSSEGKNVHVVWRDHRDDNMEIYYKHSTDAGISWSSDIRLTNDIGWSDYPTISVSGSIVHIAWRDTKDGNTEIYYKRSTNGGINWEADTRLSNNPAYSDKPSMSVSGSNVFVVWSDERDVHSEIYFKKSTNGGISWGQETRLTNSSYHAWAPSVSISGSVILAAWERYYNYRTTIYYIRSNDGGITWGPETLLSNETIWNNELSTSMSGLFVHIVCWEFRNGNSDIYYKRSSDGGLSWDLDLNLSNTSAIKYYPSVSVSNSMIHTVWQENTPEGYEIFYRRSTNNGVSWEAKKRLTNEPDTSERPSVSASDSSVHVVWTDYRDSNPQIYYKRNLNGNVGVENLSKRIPNKYSLYQNYPNPFNPVTKIKFDIAGHPPYPPSKGEKMVTLKVYDILGKEIQTLVNEQLQPGSYEVTFDRSNLPSGVYFYQLKTGDFVATKKLILLK
jgi:hypothetical protein